MCQDEHSSGATQQINIDRRSGSAPVGGDVFQSNDPQLCAVTITVVVRVAQDMNAHAAELSRHGIGSTLEIVIAEYSADTIRRSQTRQLSQHPRHDRPV
jgi:hypothetical protein